MTLPSALIVKLPALLFLIVTVQLRLLPLPESEAQVLLVASGVGEIDGGIALSSTQLTPPAWGRVGLR